MLENSKHSLLIYCTSLWCCLSSSTILLLVVLKDSCKVFKTFYATETWLVNSSYFFDSASNLDVISNNFFDMSLFSCNKSFCWRILLSCNAKKDAIKFPLLIFSNCPLVRICHTMINWKFPTLKMSAQLNGRSEKEVNLFKFIWIYLNFFEFISSKFIWRIRENE